ncbi:hypothetical protein IAT38_007954 [Cryptococcus sp. DSM 104549]
MSRSSPAADDDEPRRGGRVRKQVDKFDASQGGNKGKKRAAEDDEEDDELESSEEDESDHEPTPTRAKKRAAPAPKKAKAPAAAKKPRKSKGKANGAKAAEDGDAIKADSALFNALQSPDIALQPLIDEWVETYQQATGDEVSEQTAIHELVVFFIRCCGMSSEIEQAEATDDDGIPDVVERIQDENVRVALAAYPLVTRSKDFRPFKSNLNEFISHLITSLSLTPILFHTIDTTPHFSLLVPLLLNWLMCMSSSPLRPIRHTSTYITLKINSALCGVAATVSSDLSTKQRQRDAEVKKNGTSAAAQKRLKDAEAKVKEVHERKQRLEELMGEIFDVMFVHRVRDADPAIRTDCFRELGVWAKKYPEFYMDSTYLTYFAIGCGDSDQHARLETVKALAALYSRDVFISKARTLTIRLAPRIVEMASLDIDLSVRVNALQVITLIDKTGILQDEDENEREKVARMVFDPEPRVRKAVSGFIVNLWEERKENLQTEWSGLRANKKKRAGQASEDEMAAWLSWKALAGLLVDTSALLDKEAADGEGEGSVAGGLKPNVLPPTSTTGQLTRAVAAVESICAEHELWKDWEELVDYLLLDHSTADLDMWLLTEEEETFMLRVLLACIKRDDKDEDEEDREARSKTLMKVLPRLFAKHQSDVSRMPGILSIPENMKLDLYLDMRQTTAYESLWDDITKQFLQHTDPAVLTAAIRTINCLSANTSMSASNTTKLTELQESLFASLRDTIGSDDVAVMSIEEDRLAQLEAILYRVSLLQRSRDLVEVMEDEEGGQSSAWDIVCAFAQRGGLGYKEEAKLVENAVQTMFLHMTWVFRKFTEEDAQDPSKVDAMNDKRDKAVRIFQELTLGDAGNTADAVRRQAFISFINIYQLFTRRKGNLAPAANACPLVMEDEVQHRLGGAFLAAVEKYASDLEDRARDAEGGEGQAAALAEPDATDNFLFLQVVAVFVSALSTGTLEIDHAKEPLAHYGRFGTSYDAVVRRLVDVLRDEGIYNKEADTVQHVAGSALQQSFNIWLDSDAEEPTAPIALAKLLSSAFVIHGSQFAVLRQLHPSDVCDFHVASLDFVSRRLTTIIKQESSAKNKDQKARLQRKRFAVLTFFKTLVLLLGPVTGKDALKIKSHLEDAVSSAGAEVSANKGWEAYRAYEKRLVAIASKDPRVKLAAGKKKPAGDKQVDTEAEEEPVGEDEEEEREVTPTPGGVAGKGKGRARSNTISRNATSGPSSSTPNGNATSSLTPPPSGGTIAGQKHGREESAELDLDLDMSPPAGEELDLDLDLDGVETSQRERSASAEPTGKRRKTGKKA